MQLDIRDIGSIPESGKSPGEGHGNPLQYSCLENPTDRGAWRAPSPWVPRVGHDLATKRQYNVKCLAIHCKCNGYELGQTAGDVEG